MNWLASFGMLIPNRHGNSGVYRYGFNGKENDNEVMGEGNFEDYGMRMYNTRIGRFFNVDPLTKKYPELTPYQFASNTPIQAIDLDGLEAFFIHGTTSSSTRWTGTPEAKKAVKVLLELTNNKTFNTGFSWKAPITNSENTRAASAKKLAEYVIKNHVEGEEITLIGHSHGGNVAIQAADLIYKATGQKVNIITVATPSYNKEKDIENPKSHVGINDHIALWNDVDSVSGGAAGEDNYTNSPKTHNVQIDLGNNYKKETSIKGRYGQESTITTYDHLGAHSFDVEHPETIEKSINEGKVKKLKPIKK